MTWGTHYQVWVSAQDTAFTYSEEKLLCNDPEETLLDDFYLNDAGLLLTTADFQSQLTSINCPRKAEFNADDS